MKISIAGSILILAVGTGIGWVDRQQLAAIRTTQKLLAADAAKLGLLADGAIPLGRRKRPDHPVAEKLSTAQLVALAGEIRPEILMNPASSPANESARLRLFDSLAVLSPDELIALLEEIATIQDLDPAVRLTLRTSCTTILANDHPQAALEEFERSPDLFREWSGDALVGAALVSWAKNDPAGALEWLRKNPQYSDTNLNQRMVSAVASQDLRQALLLTRQPGFESMTPVLSGLAGSKTLSEKSDQLAIIREHFAVRGSIPTNFLQILAAGLVAEGFEPATRWISDARLTPEDSEKLLGELHFPSGNEETGRWIGWLRESFPAKVADRRIKAMINQWASADYRAAASWAMTQPPGGDRDQVLKSIHDWWPKNDAAGKAAFAREHGIE